MKRPRGKKPPDASDPLYRRQTTLPTFLGTHITVEPFYVGGQPQPTACAQSVLDAAEHTFTPDPQAGADAEAGRASLSALARGRETMRRTMADSDAAALAILRLYDEITKRAPSMAQGEKYKHIRESIGKRCRYTPSLSVIYRALRRARKLLK